jgi:tetratricopeptide (TPR) repeat protein
MEPGQRPVILFSNFLNEVEDAEALKTGPEMNLSEMRKKLEEEIAQARKPKQKISLMNDLAMELHHTEPEQALKAAAMAAEFATDIHFVQGIARSHFSAGMAYLVLSKYEECLYAFDQAREAFRQVKDKWGESNTLNNLGSLHQRIGDYGKALDFYSESAKMKEESGDNYGAMQRSDQLGAPAPRSRESFASQEGNRKSTADSGKNKCPAFARKRTNGTGHHPL